MDAKEIIARRVAQELKNGDVVNLGIGIPTMVADYIPRGVEVMLHSENGFIGLGPAGEEFDPDVVNAGAKPASIVPGGSCFDSVMSFAIIRGGHLDMTVLGALEIDQHGSLANWMVPGKIVPGMGGAMDLVSGAKKVVIAMEHTTKGGAAKILQACTLPLTGRGVVDMIVTNLAVFIVNESELLLIETAPGISVADVQEATEADFAIAEALKEMNLGQ